MRTLIPGIAAALAAVVAVPAQAQVSIDAGVEASSDARRRGISWSDGKAALGANVSAGLNGFDIGARVTTVRGDPRHGGADAVVDVTGGLNREIGGGLRVDAFVTGHLFTGARGRMDYVELGGGMSYALGPAEIGLDARYAPDQSAIGGDNLWVGARARIGIPATPLTLAASVGRSSGSVDDPLRAARLRPGGSYADWSVGADHILGPLTVGVAYSGTDIDRTLASPYASARHTGDKVIGRIAFSF